MEGYLDYITTIAVDTEQPLQPVYGIVHNQPLDGAHRRRSCAASAAWGRCASATRRPSRRSTTPTAASSSARRTCSSTSACRAWAMRRCSAGSSRSGIRRGASYLEPDAGPWEYRGRKPHPYAFGDHVLGRLRSARPARRPPVARRAGRLLARARRQDPRRDPGARLERQVGRPRRRARSRRSRRQRAAGRRARAAERHRRALPPHRATSSARS